jgi:hypothetical protein
LLLHSFSIWESIIFTMAKFDINWFKNQNRSHTFRLWTFLYHLVEVTLNN